MGRVKKIKPDDSITESIGTPVDLSSYSAPAPVESDTDEFKVNIYPTMEGDPLPGEKKKRGRKAGTKNKSEGDPLIDGEMLVMFIDIIMPLAIAATNNMVSKDKISPDDLLLTEKMKDKMKVFADKCAETINLSMNPWVGLFVLSAGAYGYKVMELKNKV